MFATESSSILSAGGGFRVRIRVAMEMSAAFVIMKGQCFPQEEFRLKTFRKRVGPDVVAAIKSWTWLQPFGLGHGYRHLVLDMATDI